jgi:type I restriction enzyme S subunit
MTLPTGWAAVALSDICDRIVDGSHNPPAGVEGGRPMLSARNISEGRIDFDHYRYISPEAFDVEDRRTGIRPGTVLLTIVGAIGRSAVVREEHGIFTVQRSVGVLHLSAGISSEFLARRFDASDAQAWFAEKARGTAQKGVYLKTLAAFPLAIPPAAEQGRIVARLAALTGRITRVRNELARVASLSGSVSQMALLERLEASILARAFRGELVPQDPSDEPASALLERIRAQRVATARPNRRKTARDTVNA